MNCMRDRRAIIIKNPRLRKVRNELRKLFLKAVSREWNKLFDEKEKISKYKDGTVKSVKNMSASEEMHFRSLQNKQAKLRNISDKSICKCTTCGKADRDMTYNKAYDSWYCTECYDMHRTAAKFLFQTIGKTKPYGHEDTTMHELLETFVDYEISHEIELKLVREGILIYLLRFHYPRDDTSYTMLAEIQNVLGRSQKAIKFVLNSLEQEKLIELEDTYSNLKIWLTKPRGTIKAERILITIRSDSFDHTFPTTLEDFKLLIGLRSDMIEYENPELYELLANELKTTKLSREEIKHKIEELKKITGNTREYEDSHLYERPTSDLKSKKVPQEENLQMENRHKTEKYHHEKQKRRIEELKMQKIEEMKKKKSRKNWG